MLNSPIKISADITVKLTQLIRVWFMKPCSKIAYANGTKCSYICKSEIRRYQNISNKQVTIWLLRVKFQHRFIGCMYVCMNVSVLSHQKYNKKYTKGSSYNCNKK